MSPLTRTPQAREFREFRRNTGIHIEFTLTNPSEDAEAQLTAQIQNRLAGIEEAGETIVVPVSQPPWTPQQITPEGRRILGLDGNRNLIQIR